MKCITLLAVILIFSAVSIANDPTYGIPWPVGSLASMNEAKPLMNGYGDLNDQWNDFHTGIDIDDSTEPDSGLKVRCVEDGFIADIWPQGGSSGWSVIITPTMGSQNGWCYTHLENPGVRWSEGDPIDQGDFIDSMIVDGAMETHLHFCWVDKDEVETSLVNPLDYLVSEPEGSDYWQFNPDELTPEFKHMFLPEYWAYEWETQYPNTSSVEDDMIPEDEISGDVDFFFGVTLQGGDNESRYQTYWVDCVPERVYWELTREIQTGTEVLSTNYLVNFDCPLSVGDETAKTFSFRWFMKSYFNGNVAPLMCLANCGDTQGWDNLGVDNIQENFWDTDADYQFTDDTVNPVLAAYRDGPYSIDVICHAHVNEEPPNPDPPVQFARSIDCELHNFSPVVEEVIVSGSSGEVYHGEWTASGLTPVLDVTVDDPVESTEALDVMVVFSEPMDTGSALVTAGLESPYDDVTADETGWSSTNCPDDPAWRDTWHGTLSGLVFMSGDLTLSIEASDLDGNGLMDPSTTDPEGRFSDTHHDVTLVGSEENWMVSLSDRCCGSVSLADLDGDGDMEMAMICDDGYVHILGDDGSSFNASWPEQISEWDMYGMSLKSTPALADLGEDSNDDTDLIAFLTRGCGAEEVADGSNLPGWPVYTDEPGGNTGEFPGQTSPVLGDLDGDGHLELLFTRHLSPDWTANQHTVYMFEHTGGDYTWSRNLQYSSGGASVISTPAVGEISSSEGTGIVVCTAEGYEWDDSRKSEKPLWGQSAVYLLDPADGQDIWSQPADYDAWFAASPVIADVDDDGVCEVIVGTDHTVGSDRRRVLVLDGATGSEEANWYLGAGIYHSAAVADIDSDGSLDFVVPCNDGCIYGWTGDGYEVLSGFPVDIGEIPGSPAIADIDADMELEIVVGTSDGNLWALESDGSICSGYPLQVGGDIQGCPAIGEIDGDGHLEVIMVDADQPKAYCLDLGAGTFPAEMPWRQFQHDSWHTGCFEADNTVPAPPTDLEGDITYSAVGAEVDLSWDLSVNDYYSPNPQDPADVVCYFVYREWEGRALELRDRVPAGDGTCTDRYPSPSGPIVRYVVTAFDGTNESVCSNEVRFHSTDQLNLALGRPVREVFDAGGETGSVRVESPESASLAARPSDAEVEEAAPPIVESRMHSGNPECLTDGQYDESYTPSVGACAVVVDLGCDHEVTDVAVIGGSGASLHGSGAGHSVRLAGESRQYTTLRDDGEAVAARYVCVEDAAGAEEILVYGETARPERVRLQTSRNSDGWSIRLPSADMVSERIGIPSSGSTSDEGALVVYDIAGRRVWSTRAEAGATVSWDGRTDSGSRVPNGVYMVRFQCNSLVSTGRLEVIGSAD